MEISFVRRRLLALCFLLLPFLFALDVSQAAMLLSRGDLSRVGVMMGTFDPPHRGHEELLRLAIDNLKLDMILVVPNLSPLHKPNASEFAPRLEMCRLALGRLSNVVVADPETVKAASQRGLVGFISDLAAVLPGATVIQVMGEDTLQSFEKNKVQYPKNVEIAVANRSRDYVPPTRLGTNRVWALVNDKAMDISSTLLRQILQNGGRPAESLLRPEVTDFILQKNIYTPQVRPACRDLFTWRFEMDGSLACA